MEHALLTRKLTKTVIDKAEPSDRDFFLWDKDLKGFGLKVCPSGRKVYVCQYRHGSGRRAPTRRMTIGAHGSPWTVESARNEARRLLGAAVQGQDPAKMKQEAKSVLTVAELCDEYQASGTATKKASTLATDRGRIERHIKPLIGRLRLTDVSKGTVTRFMQDVAAGKTAVDVKTRKRGRAIVTGGKGTASRTVGLLGGIFSFAVDVGLMADNPVRGVKRFKDRQNQRFLSLEELQRLGSSLRQAEATGVNPSGIAIIRLLILTGCRKGEIEQLRWQDVDFDLGFLRLPDSKTGQAIRPLSSAAQAILKSLPKFEGTDLVFPGSDLERPYVGTPKVWLGLRAAADLGEVRLHDLRHSFASMAVSSGSSLPVIGALLGHKDTATTAQYAHLHDDPVRGAAETVGQRLAGLIQD
ncbi:MULTISPECIES: tyrosine-type recombinase/integrase [unclassified Hyphomonas]|jgi:integrase|uniref:tyrosine-type recombinase/integrase n=1 Tax=unclassified Hyphomonas TaxID=2630699 RepID=UPI0025BC7282|nr:MULTISPECIES: site-specific integrase [unclassified Hyphomonas]|tara:strand:+ start:5311 stop:6546 length:1236 start_codon:yes stop_codon:yes gene_type:complete